MNAKTRNLLNSDHNHNHSRRQRTSLERRQHNARRQLRARLSRGLDVNEDLKALVQLDRYDYSGNSDWLADDMFN